MTGFNAWMKSVDAVLTKKVGLTSSCLPDATWHDWFDSEMSPEDAVQCYAEDGWDDGMGMLDVL